MKQISWIAGAALAPALLSSIHPADDVVFAPAEGASITKTFAMETTTTIDDIELLVNGEPQEAPELVAEVVSTSQYTFTDTYEKVGDDRPAKLIRTFDSLGADTAMEMEHPMFGSQEIESVSESELEGKSVVFTWNDDDEEYDIAFSEEDEGADEDLLEGLLEDVDLRMFVPSGGVDEGESWEVDPAAARWLLAPGGNLHFTAEVAGDEMGIAGGIDSGMSDFARMLDDLDGSITCTYEGRRTVGDRSIGVIAVSVEVESSKDITDMLIDAGSGAPEGMDMEREVESADVDFEFEMTGTLMWDLSGGHVHSLELKGETSSVFDTVATIIAMGSEFETEEAVYSEGEVELSLEVTSE